MKKRLGGALLALIYWPSLAFAERPMNLTRGVTDISEEVYRLHMFALWVCVAIGVVVFGIMFYSIFKHRKDKGHKAATFHESTKVEVVWTIIPVIILISLAVPAAKVLSKMEDASNSELTIKVTGYQWRWHYEYPDHGVGFFSNLDAASREAAQLGSDIDPRTVDNYLLEVDNPVVIPVGKKVRFLLTSNDVIHSWGVPDLAIKKDAIPGFVNTTWAQVNVPGEYRGQCVELCGRDHGYMPIKVVALEEAAFEVWMQEQQAERAELAAQSEEEWELSDLVARGKGVYDTMCIACHQANGQGIPGVFPAIVDSEIATGDIQKHLELMLKGVPGTAMQAFGPQLDDVEMAAVIAYQRNALNEVEDFLQPSEIKAAR